LIWINWLLRLAGYKGCSAKRLAGGTLMAKFVIEASPSDKTPKRRRNPHDASLLFCCMDVLQIDHSKLARDEPLLYRELQGVCTLCPNKRDCALDLRDGFDGMRWDEWWLYCPNSAMLTTIGALQKCRHPPHYNSASAFSRLQLPKE
jgi:hypothetical protein